jgi:hypothetical protein
MIEEAEVRAKLAVLAGDELSLEDFEDWLGLASRNMHADSSPGAIDLVSSIHLLLSERDHGDLNETELRRQLLLLLGDAADNVDVSIDLAASVMRTRSASNAANLPEFSLEVQVPA